MNAGTVINYLFTGLMISRISSGSHSSVTISLLVTLIRKDIHSSALIKISDTTGMRKIYSFRDRMPDAGKTFFLKKGSNGYLPSFQKPLSHH